MNEFLGKRLDRTRIPAQVSVDPDMGSEIRARAYRRRRTPGAQIVHLLTVGLKHDPEEAVHERSVTPAHADSPALTDAKGETHFLARPRTVAHRESRKRERA